MLIRHKENTGNGMILTIVWQKPGRFPTQPLLARWVSKPSLFLVGSCALLWQSALLNPRHKAHWYSKFPELSAWSWVRGGAGGGWGKALDQKAVGMEQVPQSTGHGPKLQKFKKGLDNTLRHRVWIWGSSVWNQELDSVIFVSLFQLGYSVILWFYNFYS